MSFVDAEGQNKYLEHLDKKKNVSSNLANPTTSVKNVD